MAPHLGWGHIRGTADSKAAQIPRSRPVPPFPCRNFLCTYSILYCHRYKPGSGRRSTVIQFKQTFRSFKRELKLNFKSIVCSWLVLKFCTSSSSIQFKMREIVDSGPLGDKWRHSTSSDLSYFQIDFFIFDFITSCISPPDLLVRTWVPAHKSEFREGRQIICSVLWKNTQ